MVKTGRSQMKEKQYKQTGRTSKCKIDRVAKLQRTAMTELFKYTDLIA